MAARAKRPEIKTDPLADARGLSESKLEQKATEILHPSTVQNWATQPSYPQRQGHNWTPIQLAAARLYAKGFARGDVARALFEHLASKRYKDGTKRSRDNRLKLARTKLRAWEMEEWFRDKVFELSVIATDLEVPAIMQGVVRKGKRGDVHAAKLALQVAGRMPTDDASVATQVNVVFDGVPRPEMRGAVNTDPELNGQQEKEEVEDAEWSEATEPSSEGTDE